MSEGAAKSVAALVEGSRCGDSATSSQLFELLYDDLRRMATQSLRHEAPNLTLQATAVVHEAFMRMFPEDGPLNTTDRGELFAYACRVLQQVLIDHARSRMREKRGGKFTRVPLDSFVDAIEERTGVEVPCLEGPLNELRDLDSRRSLVLKLRFFCGFTQEEVAEALEISKSTVEREERYAKAWLKDRLARNPGVS